MTAEPSVPETSPASVSGLDATWRAALHTLLSNWRGMSTVPSERLYPHQWSWDSAFISIGLARWHQARAESELLTVFAGQWANGMVPHIVFNRSIPDEAYFPGPSFWKAPSPPQGPPVATSGITQPPVHAGAALELYRRAADRDRSLSFLARVYPRLERQFAYLKAGRDIGGAGLISIVHPWESGLDNSPFWDGPMSDLPADSSFTVPERPGVTAIDAAERPGGRDYSIYVLLSEGYRDSGYSDLYLRDEHPFVVEDPLFNTCYIWSLESMAVIAELLGRDPGPYREQASVVLDALSSRLWNADAGAFQALDLRSGKLTPAVTVGGIVPLLAAGLARQQASALRNLLLSEQFRLEDMPFGVPTNDLKAPTFDRRLYWRGPTWVNTNWLLWKGLLQHGYATEAALVRDGVLKAAETAGMHEYFDPFDGTGRGSGGFGWTAALVMDMAAGVDGHA